MVKNAVQYTDSQVDEYVKLLCSGSNASELRERLASCLSVSDRRMAFMDYLCRVGSRCLVWVGGVVALPKRVLQANRLLVGLRELEGVYWFDGRVWSQVDTVKFKMALKEFCLTKLGMTTQEWLKGTKDYLDSLREGAMLRPLMLSRSVVGFRNGVYDFTDMKNVVYHPFSDRLPVVSLLDYDYDLKAGCPLWRGFLSSVLDRAQVLLLQKFLGLGLVDRERMDAKVENSLWLVGPGGAGKSTIMNVVRYVYGEENVSSVPLGSLLSGGGENRARFLANAVGRVFNYCGEVQMEDMTRYADAFKSLCSGESQQIRRIGGNVEERSDVPYLIFNMNRKPRSRNIDSALTRRLLFVTFRSAVREEDRDPELESKLRAEAAGIRNWMMEGYLQFVEDGYKLEATKASVDETDSWLIENGQTVELFMRKMGCRSYSYTNVSEQSRWFPVKVLYQRYEAWCKKWGYERDSDQNGMGRELHRIGYRSKRASTGIQYQVYGGEGLV